MMLVGKIEKKTASLWRAECALIGAFTQGKSRANALEMLADCIEVQIGRPGLKVQVTEGAPIAPGNAFEVTVDSNQPETLIGELLKYQRAVHKLTAANVAKRMGSSNANTYSAYEQGTRTPSVVKLGEMLAAIAPELALLVAPRIGPKPSVGTPAKRKAAH